MDLFKLVGTIAVNNQKANQAIDDTTDKAEQGSSSMSGSFKKIGGAIATYFATDKIIDFGKEVVNTAAEVAAETSAFEQIMGDYSDEASAKVGKIADATGMVDTRLTPYMTSMTAKFKGLGYDVEDATGYASRGLTLAADASAFWDKSLDESMSHLNSFINGSYEGGEAIGLFANDTQMASYAVKTGLIDETKEWATLEEAKKQATRLEYAENMMKSSGATGQAAKEAGQYANVQANLNEKWRQFKADIGEPLLQNVVIPAMSTLSGWVDKLTTGFQNLPKWIEENKTKLEMIAIAVGTFATALGAYKIAQNAATIMTTIATTATTAFGSVMAFVTSPVTLVVAAIGALIAIGVLLYQNWDTIKAKAIDLWEKVKEIFGNIKDWTVKKFTEIKDKTVEIFTAVKDWISEKIQAVKDVFTKLWGHIKSIWDTICDYVEFGIQIIASILDAAFQIITLPFRFIWENCKEYVFAAWEWIKEKINSAISKIKEITEIGFNFVKEKIITPITDAKNKVVEKFNELKEKAQEKITNLKNKATETFDSIKEKISTAVSDAKNKAVTKFNELRSQAQEKIDSLKSKVTSTFNTIKEKITTPINNAKQKAVEAFNTLKSNVTDKINSMKSTVTSKFNEIKQKMQEPIQKAKDKIKEMIDKIKGFFDGLKLKLPHIKLPHFKLTGEFSLENKTVPHLSIEWYKKAMNNPMLMTEPTIFGYNPATGSMMGGGEAGAEVVSGAGSLMRMIRSAVSVELDGVAYYLQKLIIMLADFFPELIAAAGHDIVTDDGVILARYVPKFDKKLGEIQKNKERGR